MKKVYYLLSVISFASLLTFSACNKDEDAAPATPACKVTKISYDVDNYKVIEYNTQDKPVKIADFDEGVLDEYSTLEYNSQGQLSKVTGYENGTRDWYTTYEYNAKGQIIKTTDFGNDNTSSYYVTYEYDGNGNRIKATSSETANGVTQTFVTAYEYLNGNVVKEIESPGTSNEYVSTFEYYTDKEDKLRSFNEIAGGAIEGIGATPSKNLLKKSVYVDSYTSTNEYSYELNDKGFPVKVNTTNSTTYTDGGITTEISTGKHSTSLDFQCK